MGSNNLNERIRRERERRGISRQEMAEMLHVKTSTVWRWEKGITVIKIKQLQMMSFIFDLTLNDLIGDINGHEVTG